MVDLCVYLALQRARQAHSRWLQGLSNWSHKEAVKNETTKTVPVLFNYLSPPTRLRVSPKTLVISYISHAVCTKAVISLTFTAASLSILLYLSLLHTIVLLSPDSCLMLELRNSQASSLPLCRRLYSPLHPPPPALFIYLGLTDIHSSPACLSLSPPWPSSW